MKNNSVVANYNGPIIKLGRTQQRESKSYLDEELTLLGRTIELDLNQGHFERRSGGESDKSLGVE